MECSDESSSASFYVSRAMGDLWPHPHMTGSGKKGIKRNQMRLTRIMDKGMDQGTSLKRRFASGTRTWCEWRTQGEVNHMRRCARWTSWEGNKFDLIFENPEWVTTRVTCITGKRTIDGMCLDRVAPRFQKSQDRRAANGVRPQGLPRRCWPRSVRLICFSN